MELLAAVRFALGLIGNITEISICLAPIPTFWRIYKKKSVEKFSWLPYATGLLYASYWGCYSLPFITKNNMLLFTVSAIQAFLELVYLLIFMFYSPSRQRINIGAAILSIAASLAGTVAVARSAMHSRPERCIFAGLPAALVTVAMYASPLAVMKLVVQTKSVEYMPLLVSLSIFVNSVAWTVYGAMGLDLFILISEGLGALLGASQLILYAIYRNAKVEDVKILPVTDLKVQAQGVAVAVAKEAPHTAIDMVNSSKE